MRWGDNTNEAEGLEIDREPSRGPAHQGSAKCPWPFISVRLLRLRAEPLRSGTEEGWRDIQHKRSYREGKSQLQL